MQLLPGCITCCRSCIRRAQDEAPIRGNPVEKLGVNPGNVACGLCQCLVLKSKVVTSLMNLGGSYYFYINKQLFKVFFS